MSFINCINSRHKRETERAGLRLEGWLIAKGFVKEEQFENVWKLGALDISFRASDDSVCIRTSIGSEELGRLSDLKIMPFWLELNNKHFFITQKKKLN